MSLDQTDTSISVLLGALALLTALLAWLRWVRPRVHSGRATWIAVRDTLVGREAQHDTITGEQTQEALPSLGVRMKNMEDAQIATKDALEHIAELIESQQDQDRRLADHERRLTALERAS